MAVRDDFEAITESAPLMRELRERIAAEGPITFREFMAACLYHPRYGYYATDSNVTSRGGDYVTSPEVHPVFASLVAKQILEFWDVMSRPGRFVIVEQGAGSGVLARDILGWAEGEPDFARALRYSIVEPNARLREVQRRTIDDAGTSASVEWLEEIPAAIEGVVLSNELVDAFPVHRVVRQGDDLREVHVGIDDGGRFTDHLAPLSDDRLAGYFAALGVLPGDGCYAEVNLDAPRWMRDVATSLARGYVLTFDYGYEARDLYAPWRRDGTLLCFYRQTASSDPYQRIGKQDMTASVDFTSLRAAGEAAGLSTVAMTDQAAFLVRMGIGEGVAAAAGRPSEMEEYFARRRVVMDLIDPARLGRIKVLLQSKGVPRTLPRGFHD